MPSKPSFSSPFAFGAIAAAAFVAAFATSTPAEAARRDVVRGNVDGGVTAHTTVARRGAEGAGLVRGRHLRTDGDGNATFRSGGAARGPDGGRAARAGGTTVHADGSASHRSGFVAAGERGTVTSQGHATLGAAGHLEQQRTTSATSARTGNSATTTTTYNREDGRTRTTQCFDASGASLACPARP